MNTSIQPTLGVFSRCPRDLLFVADADVNSSMPVLAEAVSTASYGQSIGDGLAVDPADFRGVDQLQIENEIRGLATQYKDYKQRRLVPDLAPPDQVVLCKIGEVHAAEEVSV